MILPVYRLVYANIRTHPCLCLNFCLRMYAIAQACCHPTPPHQSTATPTRPHTPAMLTFSKNPYATCCTVILFAINTDQTQYYQIMQASSCSRWQQPWDHRRSTWYLAVCPYPATSHRLFLFIFLLFLSFLFLHVAHAVIIIIKVIVVLIWSIHYNIRLLVFVCFFFFPSGCSCIDNIRQSNCWAADSLLHCWKCWLHL